MATQRMGGKLSTVAAALGVMATMAACSKPSASKPGTDLASDLAAASDTASSLALAPVSGRTDVISAVEQAPEARRAPRASSPAPTIVHRVQHHTVAPVSAPVKTTPAPMAAAAPAPVAEAPQTQPAPAAAEPVSPRPQPVQQQQHHGRWRTEAEVIRDAPFPITP